MMTLATNFSDIAKKRRSIYSLGRDVRLSNDELIALIKDTIRETPSAMNVQSVRAVILLDDAQDKFWDATTARVKQEVPADADFSRTQAKMDGFKAAKGTVLLYTDLDAIKNQEESFPLYADNFYDWSEQAQGIAAHALWLAMADNGLGANLQHYNPLIDEETAKMFDVPANWRLRSQLVFGAIEAPAGDKDYLADEGRFLTFDK